MFRQTGLRPEMLSSLFWFHYEVWKCKLLFSIMTLLADVTYFMFICSVLMSVRPLGLLSTREKFLCMPTNVSCLRGLVLSLL